MMKWFVRAVAVLGFAGTGLAGELRELPMEGKAWFADPFTWQFRGDGVACSISNANGMAVYEGAPLSGEVTVEAVFTPEKAEAQENAWHVASVAVVDDARNYWHLALAQAPEKEGRRHFAELVQMREGRWLSQVHMHVAFDEPPEAMWEFGKAYRLTLAMDGEGITGTIVSEGDGKRVMRKRYVFSGEAVRRGRPGLRMGALQGRFAKAAAAWGAALAEPAAEAAPAYAVESGVAPGVKGKATGFFHVEQMADGRWWTVDPLGRGIALMGVDHVTFWGHWCEKLGYHPHERKNKAKYADKAQWEEEALGRLKAWGFNMLGAGCDLALKHRGLVHTVFLNFGDHMGWMGDEFDITPHEGRPCSAFPNVFHPDFEAYCLYRARRDCARHKTDPWLLGYFIDNELAWWGRGGLETGLFDAVMKKGAGHSAKRALRDFLAERAGGDVAAFNKVWGTALASLDGVLGMTALPGSTEEQVGLKRDFLELVAERYFGVASRAIRAVDPNHMVLGARFAGTGGAAPVVWEVSGKHCEIVTFNCYPMADLDEGMVYTHFGKGGEPVTEHFAKYYGYAGRPMLVTEWSFPALDAGVPSVHGAGQRFRTQAGRTAATELFAKTMLSMPFLLGYDYFMWVDEPALGISTPFPEDSNYGLINEDGVPYKELTEMFTALHQNVGRWRASPAPARREGVARRVPTAEEAVRRVEGKGSVKFERTPKTFWIDNGIVRLEGEVGTRMMVRNVTLTGEASTFGAYNGMVHVVGRGGEPRWCDVERLTKAEVSLVDGVAVAELTGETRLGADGAFEVTQRLRLAPGASWFVCEVVRVRNIGERALPLRGVFFRVYAAFKETPEATPPNVWGMPPSGVWLDKAGGRYFGAVAPRWSSERIHFWLNPNGGAHPDAWLPLDNVALAPDATWEPAEPAYVICAVGLGGEAAWQAELERLTKRLE